MRNFVMVGLLLAGCSSSGADEDDVIADRQIPAGVRGDAESLAQANNQFAADLYAKLAATPGNLCISPYSISTALAMLDAGAATTSDQELRAALHVELPGDRFHAAQGAILTSLDTGRDHGAYTLAAANRLFGQQGFPFLPSFVKLTGDNYGAPLLPVDFAGNSEAARATINQWVAAQTDDKIKQLFSSHDITADTKLALVNALVFKGAWQTHFDRARTADAAFTRADGSTVQVPMMHKSEAISARPLNDDWIDTGEIDALGILPFRGKDLSMVIVLPRSPDGLPRLEADLANLAEHIDQTAAPTEEKIQIALPKFSFSSAHGLIEPLQALGVTSVFDPSAADLSGIDGARDLSVGAVVHQAFIAVDEEGAEAAAATGVGIIDTAGSAVTSLIADRPFLFAIYDHVTHSILFLGRVTDPTAL